jgi:hypothetical protein
MNKFSLSIFLDTIFFLLIGFFLSYPFFKGFIIKPLCFLSAFCFALILALVCNKIMISREKVKFSNKKEQKDYLDRLTQINLLSREELFTFFKDYLVLKRIKFNQTRYGFSLTEKKILLFFKFAYEKIEKVDVVKYFNLLDEDFCALVITNEVDEDVVSFSKRFNGRVVINDFKKFYLDLKEIGFFPPEKYILLEESPKAKFTLSKLLKRKNAKNFFVFGVVFSIMSFIVPIKTYYIVWSGIFLILSLLTKLYGRDEIKTKNPI